MNYEDGPVRVGVSMPRLEDDRLLRGAGCFTDDISVLGQAHATLVRSPHAHARIQGMDVDEARQAPGVLAVYTAPDLTAAGVGPLREKVAVAGRDGGLAIDAPRPLIAAERVMHVGDIVAMVVAGTPAEALDAAELIDVDYDVFPSVTQGLRALEADAPQLWPDAPSNMALHWEGGDAGATRHAFEHAHHVTELELVIDRVSAGCMETRGAVAQFDRAGNQYLVYAPSQGANMVRDGIAGALGVQKNRVRVVTPDVGGAFGIKIPAYPEYALVAFASRQLMRPVKWMGERGDSFMSDGQCRDHVVRAGLALDAQGRMLAVRCETVANMGAYTSAAAISIPTTGGIRCLTGVYAIPVHHAEAKIAFTNTVPVVAYRGAGKPEFNYVVERLVDTAAREIGMDPAALRRLNAVSPEAMPHRTPVGLEFDSGDFVHNMDAALERADRAGFPARREKAKARGKLRGFGFAVFQEPDGPVDCRLALSIDASGNLTVTTTSQSGGQGHETFMAQLAAQCLGLPPSKVHVVQGDSDRTGPGFGTGGSNLATVTGTAFVKASERIVERGCMIAGRLLEASEVDIEFVNDVFRVAGTDAQVSLEEVARAAFNPAQLEPGMELGLDALSHYKGPAYSYPCGCHVCEVEIDPETGVVRIERYVAIDDHGVAINPMLLEGQAQGGIAQGIGEVLLERIFYEHGSGQLLSGSFLDYCMPRADDLPAIEFENHPVPCKTNLLGAKGVGESGCTGSLPAVANAVVDALSELGVTGVDLPVLPEAVWRLCAAAS
ncbi:MAG: xanthine dehydrogenase family protein molybdopterin-binding subunit [Gammaproteobacteria bacterium]